MTTSHPTQTRGADLVLRALCDAGVDTVFTLSGNHIMSLFDAAVDGPRLIHTRHEAAAVHMADAYGRLNAKPGIAMATGGPGHANAVPALYSALAADSPVVLLSGHAPTDQIGLGAFQELRQADLAAPVTKASTTVTRAEDLYAAIRTALDTAMAGRPGPVHVSLPSDLIDAPVAFEFNGAAAGQAEPLRDREATGTVAHEAFAALQAALEQSERPLLVGGPVMSRDPLRKQFLKTAADLGLPAVVMESPRGLNDPSLGAFAEILPEADLIILAAKPLDFTLKFARPPAVNAACRIITLEPDAPLRARVLERGPGAAAFAMQPAEGLELLAALPADAQKFAGWRARVDDAVSYRPADWNGPIASPTGTVHPLALCRALDNAVRTHPQATLICDGGEIGQWAQTVPHPRRLTNSVSGAIGASLPYAIGAALVDSAHPIIAVMGDGTVGFHLAEFDTAVRYDLPIVVIVGNDACWNAEKQIQLRDYGPDRAHGCDLLPTRYDEVCAAMGGKGILVTEAADLDAAIADAIASRRPTCINVMLDGQAAPVLRRGN